MLVLKNVGINLHYDYSKNNKRTARCPEQIVGHDDEGNEYLVIYAGTNIQRFYAERAIFIQKKAIQYLPENMRYNVPIYSGMIDDGFYAVYHYYDRLTEVRDSFPDEWIRMHYEKNGIIVECNDAIVKKIEEDFLSAWPETFHNDIKNLKEFNLFHQGLIEYQEICVCFQHGDYTPNNILMNNNGCYYLMDFEFSQMFQPIGFDLYDYHYSSDKKFENIPYLEVNEIKEKLQNKINEIVDMYFYPTVSVGHKNVSEKKVHWADDMIYNRPDIFDNASSRNIVVKYGEEVYELWYSKYVYKAELAVWLRQLPASVIDAAVDFIFKIDKTILKIEIKYSNTNCKNMLNIDNNWIIFMPEKPEEVFYRMSKKSRYNFNREKRLLEGQVGDLTLESYSKDIPEDIFIKYFEWKKNTHGTDYGLSAKEYIDMYHVTDAMVLKANGQFISILLYCKSENTIYLENLSYNTLYSKCSPGIILYEYFLEQVTSEKMQVVFLGNGVQPYKTRFGSKEYIVYSGNIYRNRLVKKLIKLKNIIKSKNR